MKIYYSAKTGGFYVEGIHAEIPDDAVSVSEKMHTRLMEGQAAGKRIVADERGKPRLADPEGPTEEQAAVTARRRRNALLAASDARMLPDFPQTKVQRQAWIAYRTQLRDVTQQAGFPLAVEWPEPPAE